MPAYEFVLRTRMERSSPGKYVVMFGMPVEWEVDTSSAAGNENPGTAFPPSPTSKVLFLQRIPK